MPPHPKMSKLDGPSANGRRLLLLLLERPAGEAADRLPNSNRRIWYSNADDGII